MAAFPENSIGEWKTYEEVAGYLVQLDENLRRTFAALDPEENFSPDALVKYQEKMGKVAAFELSVNGMQSVFADLQEETLSQLRLIAGEVSLKVSKGGVTSAFNMENGEIRFSGPRLRIICKNFTADPVTGQYAMTGKITAEKGEIAGWSLGKGSNGDQYIYGEKDSRIEVGSIESDKTWGFDKVEVLGDTDFRGAKIVLDGSDIDTDKTTIFQDGFTGRHIDAGPNTVTCGAARAYQEITVEGQITCKSCYTSRDGKTWSDARLKKNIREIGQKEAERLVQSLQPYSYDMIEDGRRSSGFLAQEVQPFDDGYGLVGKKRGGYSLRYAGFIPFLVKIVQEQTETIRRLTDAAERDEKAQVKNISDQRI